MGRSKRGQSLVEYALGIGCVAAVSMVAFAALGHLSGHILQCTGNAVNHPVKAPHAEELVDLNSQPWNMR